jgi:hypothetical protein
MQMTGVAITQADITQFTAAKVMIAKCEAGEITYEQWLAYQQTLSPTVQLWTTGWRYRTNWQIREPGTEPLFGDCDW